jgi:diguanylate cyclase (GGDEF)-like protein
VQRDRIVIYLQNLVLEMIARGDDLRATATKLCEEVEGLSPGAICSILAVDAEGHLHTVAAPSLPAAYLDALEDASIGPSAGSCGTAAFRGKAVTVTDIAKDPLWAGYRELPLPADLRACWSSPIVDAAGAVLGTFAFYYRETRGPTQFEREIVAKCVHLCLIAFERDNRLKTVQRLLYIDPLTNLRNRTAFEGELTKLDGACAMLLVNIDDMKSVNDTFGHRTGDRLIQIVADRIAGLAPANSAFRLGGDELAVIIPASDVSHVAHAMLKAVGEPADCEGHSILPTVTIGAVQHAADDQDGANALLDADLALAHGKSQGGSQLVIFTPQLRTRMNQRLRAITQVRSALQQGRVETRYQPIARLADNRLVGVEALCRIRQRDGSVTAAIDFHEAFADARNAAGVTQIMLQSVAADLRRWRDAGLPIGHVAVNLSPSDFARGSLADEVRTIFAAAQVPLHHLMLEITETVYLGRRDLLVHRQIDELRAAGVKLALDDFGTGYASLTHLISTPVDMLKIDKSFVDHLNQDGHVGGAAVINGLMRIAEKLGIEVVAEGIETEEQRELLLGLGCLCGQGYLFAPALEPDELGRLLARAAQPHTSSQRSVPRSSSRPRDHDRAA